jgi:hypothetical protein
MTLKLAAKSSDEPFSEDSDVMDDSIADLPFGISSVSKVFKNPINKPTMRIILTGDDLISDRDLSNIMLTHCVDMTKKTLGNQVALYFSSFYGYQVILARNDLIYLARNRLGAAIKKVVRPA